MLDATTKPPAAHQKPIASRAIYRRGAERDPLIDRGVDGHTVIGSRIRRAWRTYLAAMGHPTDALARANAASAAELRVAVEDMQARLRLGEPVTESLTRLAHLHDKAERKLGIGKSGAKVNGMPAGYIPLRERLGRDLPAAATLDAENASSEARSQPAGHSNES
jgi:hypothetical protein